MERGHGQAFAACERAVSRNAAVAVLRACPQAAGPLWRDSAAGKAFGDIVCRRGLEPAADRRSAQQTGPWQQRQLRACAGGLQDPRSVGCRSGPSQAREDRPYARAGCGQRPARRRRRKLAGVVHGRAPWRAANSLPGACGCRPVTGISTPASRFIQPIRSPAVGRRRSTGGATRNTDEAPPRQLGAARRGWCWWRGPDRAARSRDRIGMATTPSSADCGPGTPGAHRSCTEIAASVPIGLRKARSAKLWHFAHRLECCDRNALLCRGPPSHI